MTQVYGHGHKSQYIVSSGGALYIASSRLPSIKVPYPPMQPSDASHLEEPLVDAGKICLKRGPAKTRRMYSLHGSFGLLFFLRIVAANPPYKRLGSEMGECRALAED